MTELGCGVYTRQKGEGGSEMYVVWVVWVMF